MKILICGSQLSGKTTLFNALVNESHLVSKLPQIKEDAAIARANNNSFSKLQEDIVEKQGKLESEQECFISDRSALDAVVYALESLEKYDIAELYRRMPLLEGCVNRYRSSLFFLIHPLKEFVNDGVRRVDNYEERVKYTNRYSRLLDELRIPYLEIRTTDHRVRLIIMKEAVKGKQELKCYNLQAFASTNTGRKKSVGVLPLHNINFPFYLSHVSADVTKIPRLQISEVSFELSWVELSPGKSNRFLDFKGNANDLFVIQFLPSVRSKAVQNLLLNGVNINGEVYNFLGCSSSGLKLRKCYLYKGNRIECDELINEMGEFKSFKSVSKMLARIGLLFSEVFLSRVIPNEVIERGDVERNGNIFTDGCGGISIGLANQIFSKIKDNKKVFKISDDLPLPAVYQIRLQGYKGVVALDTHLPNDSLLIRPSMRKFSTHKFAEIGICDFSKPHTFGNLNKQFIALLSGLGIADSIFMKKQSEYFHLIKHMLNDVDAATKILQWHNEFNAVTHISRIHGDDQNKLNDDFLKNKLLSIQSKLVESSERLRLLIVNSRTLFGICDPFQILDYGQCFLRLTVDGEVQTLSGQVIIGKNPSYLLSDIRVLEAVDEISVPELSKLNHLHDCIVFPTRGDRPHPDEIAGSDLDGDMFFVSWDPDLIPKSIRHPFAYPAAASRPEGRIDFPSQVKYFSEQNQVPMSLVDKLFWRWADKKGVTSQECERLGQLFSRTVDSAKSGEKISIPKALLQILDNNESQEENSRKFIWQKMRLNAENFKEIMKESIGATVQNLKLGLSFSCISDIIYEHISNLSEFQKFDLAWRYFLNKGSSESFAASEIVEQFGDALNFSLFTNFEKKIAIDRGLPSNLIHNALNKSEITSPNSLKRWNMTDSPFTWHLVKRCYYENFDWNIILKVLSTHDNTLVMLQLPDNVKLIFQFNQRFNADQTSQPVNPGSIVAILFSEHFDIAKRIILGDSYVIDLCEDRLQIYEGSQSNTFVWLKFSDSLNNSQKKLDETDCFISVALNRFDKRIYDKSRHPGIRKIPFERIEIFTSDKPSFFCIESNTLSSVPEALPDEESDDTDSFDMSCIIQETFELMNQEDVSLLFRLSKLCAHFTSEALPAEFTEVIENSVVSFDSASLDDIINLIYFLYRLKIDHLAVQTTASLKVKVNRLGITTWISALSKWQIFWYLDESAAQFLISNFLELFPDTESNIAINYIKHFSLLLALDFIEELRKAKDLLSTQSTGNVIKNLKVDCHPEETLNPEENLVPLYCASLVNSLGNFKPGQMVAIFRQKASGNFRMTLCVGEIVTIRQCPFSVTIKIHDDYIPSYLKYCLQSPRNIYFQIVLVGNVVTYNRCMEAILCLCDFDQPRTTLLPLLADPLGHSIKSPLYQCGKVSPREIKSIVVDEYTSNSLNDSQIEAVNSAFKEDICLIQGPPGTGKTTVACEIIRFAHRLNAFNGILVCAETNLAVDNIARKLIFDDSITILRVGNIESIGTDLFDITLDGQLKRASQLKSKTTVFTDRQGISHRDSKLVEKIVKSSDVILTTCSGAGDSILKGFKFEFVLCDEATQSIEPSLLCALVHGSNKLCLIGDSNQIGPFNREIKNSSTINLPNINLLTETLFHRLQERDYPVHLLNVQYRMHPAIMTFPSKQFYNDALQSGVNNNDRPAPSHFKWPKRDCPIAFISSKDNAEKRKGSSFENVDECCKILHCVEAILSPGSDLMQSDIGVITPYNGQLRCIRERLASKFPNIEVKTVDGFQGREKEVIIASLVRSNYSQKLGFLDDSRRMNVLLTRARRGLIVVGNRDTLSNSSLWNEWMNCVPEYCF